MTAAAKNLKFRYDINALRAIAVLSVLFFHYHIPLFSGGFVGVDIFFVISGYLMTNIVAVQLDSGKFSLLEFYGKRVKRIIPALLFLTSVLITACFFFYFPADYQLVGRYASSSMLFLSNVLYWQSSNYFDPASQTILLLHTWSLSVEWQFYLIYPLVLMGLYKWVRSRYRIKWIIVVSTVCIFIMSLVVTKYKGTASFYLLPTRSWEMLIGGIAFYLTGYIENVKQKKILAFIGYGLILLSILFLNEKLAWPGIFTLIPVLATFLVIILNSNQFSALHQNLVLFFGKISYSLYLWHWPIFVIAAYLGLSKGYFATTVLIILSIGIAYLSFRYIESVNLKVRPILMATFVIIVLASVISFKTSNSFIFKKKSIELSNYMSGTIKDVEAQYLKGGCYIWAPDVMDHYNKTGCLSIDPHKKNYLLLGDSHAAHFFESMNNMLAQKNINLIKAAASGCAPIINTNGAPECEKLISFIYQDFIVHNYDKLDGVVISANWSDKGDSTTLVKDLQNTIAYLGKYHLKAIVIGQNKMYDIPYPSIAAKDYEYNLFVDNRFVNSYSREINKVLKKEMGTIYIDIYDYDSFPKVSANNVPYMIDAGHYTEYGSDSVLASFFKNKLVAGFF